MLISQDFSIQKRLFNILTSFKKSRLYIYLTFKYILKYSSLIWNNNKKRMRFLICLLVVCVVMGTGIAKPLFRVVDPYLNDSWENFKQFYNKVYDSPATEIKRHIIFKKKYIYKLKIFLIKKKFPPLIKTFNLGNELPLHK